MANQLMINDLKPIIVWIVRPPRYVPSCTAANTLAISIWHQPPYRCRIKGELHELRAERFGWTGCRPCRTGITRLAPRGSPSAIGQLSRSSHLPASPRARLHFVQPLSAPRTPQAQSTLSPDRGQKSYVRDAAIVSTDVGTPAPVSGIPRPLASLKSTPQTHPTRGRNAGVAI